MDCMAPEVAFSVPRPGTARSRQAGGREAARGADRCSAKRRQGLGSLAAQKYSTDKKFLLRLFLN